MFLSCWHQGTSEMSHSQKGRKESHDMFGVWDLFVWCWNPPDIVFFFIKDFFHIIVEPVHTKITCIVNIIKYKYNKITPNKIKTIKSFLCVNIFICGNTFLFQTQFSCYRSWYPECSLWFWPGYRISDISNSNVVNTLMMMEITELLLKTFLHLPAPESHF